MSNFNPQTSTLSDAMDNELEDILSSLRVLQPRRQHQKAQLFALLYPHIVVLLSSKVTQRAILEVLQSKGLKLHPARFKELMVEHAKLDAERGSAVVTNEPRASVTDACASGEGAAQDD